MKYFTDIFPAIEAAEDKLQSVQGDMSRLPESLRIFLLVNGAQGIIDNGGYLYFFEADFPGTPPYDNFISAYEAIGCEREAADLRRVVATFPFESPHLHKEQRQAFIYARYDKKKSCVPEWGNKLCGDKKVWEKLAGYYRVHKADFV